jgi:membrane protein YqaA with SNARE-associated domain
MTTLAGLFLGAFLAATILPFSSEVMLVAALAQGDLAAWLLVAVAAAGNILGAMVNWALGRFLLHWQDQRWFPVSRAAMDRAAARFNRYGAWTLLLAWVPVIGDPLTFVAGVLRVPLPLFLALVAVGKTARYVVVAWAVAGG